MSQGESLSGKDFKPLTVGVLALQGGIEEHERALHEIGCSTLRVKSVKDLARVDGLVLPGGESTTMSRLARISGLVEPLTDALREGMPAFGTCAGMILLASDVADTRPDAINLSAIDIGVRRNAFGRQTESFEATLEVAGLDAPMRAVFIRAPQVERVGAGVQILATVPEGPAAGAIVAVRQGSVIATAFHPELTPDTRLHELFVAQL